VVRRVGGGWVGGRGVMWGCLVKCEKLGYRGKKKDCS